MGNKRRNGRIRLQNTDNEWTKWFDLDSITDEAFKAAFSKKYVKSVHIEEMLTKAEYERIYGTTLPSLPNG